MTAAGAATVSDESLSFPLLGRQRSAETEVAKVSDESLSSPLLGRQRSAASEAEADDTLSPLPRASPAGCGHISESCASSPIFGKTGDVVTIREFSFDRDDWTPNGGGGDTLAGLDRRARYERMAMQWSEDARAQQSRKRLLERGSSRLRRRRTARAYSWYFLVHNASLAAIAWLACGRCRWIASACLAPTYAVSSLLSVWIACTDRDVAAFRLKLRGRPLACLQRLCFELFVLVGLGLFFGRLLVNARRYEEAENSFLMQLEEFDASRREIAVKPRFETHLICAWGAPVMLACAYIVGALPLSAQDALAVTVLLGNCVSTVTLACVNFDFSTSRFIRERYGTTWDGHSWVQRDRRLFFRFRKTHQAFRLLGVAMRMLVFVAGSMASLCYPLGVLALGVLDYLWGLAVLSSKSRLSWRLPVLGVTAFVANPCRFVDEPGYALPAQQVSAAMYFARVVEGVLAALVYFRCSQPGAEAWAGPVGGRPAEVLLGCLLFCLALHFCLGTLSALGRQGGDLFTAVAERDPEAIEESLCELRSLQLPRAESMADEAPCMVNMRLQDGSRRTALHLAAGLGDLECVRCLLRSGADATLQDARGDNAVHLAARAGDLKVAELLLAADGSEEEEEERCGGALRCLVQTNRAGQRPLDAVARRAPRELAQLLEEKMKVARKKVRINFASGSNTSIESELAESVFGAVVGGQGFHISYGQLSSPVSGDFSAFLLLRGIGNNISQLYEDFHEWRSGCCVRLSCLRIARTLGEGSFGKVLQVQDMRSGQSYAMKLQRKTQAVKCAMREAVALHSTRHPFIVRVIHVFHTTALFGILLELCEMDLNKRIFDYADEAGLVRGLPLAKSARYAACMLLALEYLHRRSIVFCDLKPENVLTTYESEGDLAKLADFGLARSVACSDVENLVTQMKSGQRAGTPAFLPSEVWQSSPKIQTADDFMDSFTMRDWYAFGCCLLLMLLGEYGGTKAFAGGRHVLLPLAQDEVPAVLARANELPGVDADALGLVADLMAPEPALRAGPTELRQSALLRDAIASMEATLPDECCRP